MNSFVGSEVEEYFHFETTFWANREARLASVALNNIKNDSEA